MNESENIEIPVRHTRIYREIVPIAITTLCILILMIATLLLILPRIVKSEYKYGSSSTAPMDGYTEPLLVTGQLDSDESLLGIRNLDAEQRGIYIATAANINYPSKPGLSVTEQRAELDDIVATCAAANLNAIYFQARPASDALYRSRLFPTSSFITGNQGDPLEFDPLEYLIEIAHEKNIEVHAWVNPLRVTTGSASLPQTDTNALAPNNPARLHPEWTVAYADGRLYYNPGLHEVRALVAAGVREIVENYAVDGIIFDDYFYPYPVSTTVNGKSVVAKFDDSEAFKEFGYGASLDDWRRANINAMIEASYLAVKSVREECEFGVAPFGIWQNKSTSSAGSDTKGLESYSAIYCDPTAWVKGGYIDYIAPQLYWRFSTSVARYDTLVRWWNTLVEGTGVELLISHGVYNYADIWEDAENELRDQVEFARAESSYRGSILYGYAALKSNAQGLFDETAELFKRSVIHSDVKSNGRELIISIPNENSYIDGDGTFLLGTSDPTEPLYIDGVKIGRTKSGYFSVYLPLKQGKNTFTFEHKGTTREYVINRGTAPVKYGSKYEQLNGYTISATPSGGHFSTSGELKLSVTAPSGSKVTAEINGRTYSLSPTIYPKNEGAYMKEVYTRTLTFSLPAAGQIRNVGCITFSATRGSESATCKSEEIKFGGAGAVIPIEITKNDTEMKIQPNSWYYDDYSVQSAGMRDNAVSLTNGWYKLRCGGYVAEANAKQLDLPALAVTSVSTGVIETDAKATYVRFKVGENVPVNCYIENGEFVITLYNMNTSAAPTLAYVKNPIFTEIRGAKSAKVNSYKYFCKLVNIENFYGFDYYYENGILTVELTNPTTIPDSDRPLEGKTVILDAGHGGKNPGALGPLGYADGAMNESAFNLEIVMAAVPKLEALGANVVLTRDRESTIDVPIQDRMNQLIEVDPDLVISVHQNSMPYNTDVTKVRGLVGLYWSDSGYMLTSVLGETMSDALNKGNRSPTKQRLAMVRNPKFPSTLVEVCFITNVEEYERMMQPDAIDVISTSIADSVINFYHAQEKYILD